ncbi:hypothetical protein BDZ97DRAFT_1091787 [Flammula alnicola]|nr:hypothetical protein BDZ97DRAFT_1091787 [Flammula alnicola]
MASADALDITDTFGALLIGALVTMTIYGITTLQAYFYYVSFPRDGRATKLLVALIWSLDTIHAIFMCHALHFYLIVGFVDHSLLINGTWSLFMSVAINVILAFIVQAFFTHRIFLLCSVGKRNWVTGVIGFFVIAHFGEQHFEFDMIRQGLQPSRKVFGIMTVVNLFVKKRFILLQEVSLSSVVPFGIATILSDIMIAVALVINKLIIFAINRCILTSAVAIVEMIIFKVLPNSFYSFAIDFVIGKLYANSLLAVLNARAKLRSDLREDFSSTEMSTRFNITSAVANHQTNLIQVRTRESSRNNINTDPEKVDTQTLMNANSGMKRTPLENGEMS